MKKTTITTTTIERRYSDEEIKKALKIPAEETIKFLEWDLGSIDREDGYLGKWLLTTIKQSSE